MRLSTEGRRARWLIMLAAWVLVAWVAAVDARATSAYVAMLDDSGLLPADSLALRRPVPAEYADAQTWLRYAVEIAPQSGWQVRHTTDDNAPAGRDIHWNSGFVHLIALAGRIRATITGESLPSATERATAWFNLPLFLIVVIAFSAWVAHRTGAAGGVIIALGMLGHRWFYDGFAPNYVDHHGLLTAAALGVVLGALFMGGGWWNAGMRPGQLLPGSAAEARRAAIVSAVAGGLGLWVSAASVIPMIATVGVAATIATWAFASDARAGGGEYDAALWRLWGRVGAAVAFIAYLVEYAPHHMAMRLEVNHPLYALAWLGGGELIAAITEWRVHARRPVPWRVGLAGLAVVAPLLVLAIGGAAVFVPLDPGMARLHGHIAEFQSIASIVSRRGASYLGRYVVGLLLVLPALLAFRRRSSDRVALAMLGVTVVVAVVMACVQVRWWMPASAAELCLVLAAVATLTAAMSDRGRWTVVLVIGAFCVEQAAARIFLTRSNVATRAVTREDALQPLYRDAAIALRATQPAGPIVLLASPTASMGVGYFGGFQGLGTLYWENMDGLRAAAAILSARTDDEARTLARARGVTHVVMVSDEDFLTPYLELARPGSTRADLPATFGYRLLVEGAAPRWLRPVPFVFRRDAAPGLVVRLYQVVPDQRDDELFWGEAVEAAALGDSANAEKLFARVIDAAPAANRASMYEDAGRAAYRYGAHALALRLFRVAMSNDSTPTLRLATAWILATSPDDAVRNGPAAFAMLEPVALANEDDPAVLDVVAAALAESGRFADAVNVQQRVVARARALGSSSAGRMEARLNAYRAGRPWRQ